MELPHGGHVAVVDGTHFNLYRNEGEETALKLRKVDAPSVDAHGGGQHDHDDGGRRGSEHNHAAGVAAALNHAVLTHTIDKLIVIADPTTLGEMRQHYHKELQAALVGELHKTLTNASQDDIAKSIRAA